MTKLIKNPHRCEFRYRTWIQHAGVRNFAIGVLGLHLTFEFLHLFIPGLLGLGTLGTYNFSPGPDLVRLDSEKIDQNW